MARHAMATMVASALMLVISAAAADSSARTIADGGAGAPKSPQSGMMERVLGTLAQTSFAVFIGFVVVRLRLLVPEQGDMKGVGFYVGQIAFPVLFFKTIVSAKLGDVDVGTILACSLGKAAVMAATWALVYVAYRPSRSRGQRFATASVFAFFATASNDFAVGLPIVQALYNEEADMDIYIAGNALVTPVVFVPLSTILCAIGQGMQDGEGLPDGGAASGSSSRRKALNLLREIVVNPIMIITVLGLAYKGFLGFTLVDQGNSFALPNPLGGIVDLVTSPFGMCALFMTGINLRKISISLWLVLLVMMKVVFCAYVTYALADLLVPDSYGPAARARLHSFGFLYGMIPSSTAPLVFADRYDPGSSLEISTAIVIGMIVSGPMMFGAALFLDSKEAITGKVITRMQLTTAVVGLVSGGIFMAMVAVTRKAWDAACLRRVLILAYGTSLVAYEGLMLAMNPDVSAASCMAHNSESKDPILSPVIAWVQSASSLLVLMMQAVEVVRKTGWSPDAPRRRLACGLATMCWLVALLPGLATVPSTITEMCSTVRSQRTKERSLRLNFAWNSLQLATSVLLGVVYCIVARQRRRQRTARKAQAAKRSPSAADGGAGGADRSPSVSLSGVGLAGAEVEGAAAAGRPPDAVDSDAPDAESLQASSAGDPSASSDVSLRGVAQGLVFYLVVRLFTRIVNITQIVSHRSIFGGFGQMLVVEDVLEHSQLVVLLGLMIADAAYVRELRAGARAWWCGPTPGPQAGRVRVMSTVLGHY